MFPSQYGLQYVKGTVKEAVCHFTSVPLRMGKGLQGYFYICYIIVNISCRLYDYIHLKDNRGNLPIRNASVQSSSHVIFFLITSFPAFPAWLSHCLSYHLHPFDSGEIPDLLTKSSGKLGTLLPQIT